MPEFLKLLPPEQALILLLDSLPDRPVTVETIPTPEALRRVTAEDVLAPQPLPAFVRATVDGYALRARDTFGASDSSPAYLTQVGEIPMGAAPAFALRAGQAALIHTGGMLPDGTDAVVMLEFSSPVGSTPESGDKAAARQEIEIVRPVAEGENILLVGEDVAEGQVTIPCGTRLRPEEIGGAMALGLTSLRVAVRPKVGILSSGDEIIPPDRALLPAQVRDVNTYSLAALVTEAGGDPVLLGIVPDRLAVLKKAASKAKHECDLLVITAGSSASSRDMTAEAIASLGGPGVLVHGVNVRPGKPTILAVCEGTPVIGLPGNPVSALVIARLFVLPVIERLSGLRFRRPRPCVSARLALNVSSQAGREDWVAVQLSPGENGWQAEPVFAKSNLIFSLVRSDGLIRVPPDATGLSAGEIVTVFLT